MIQCFVTEEFKPLFEPEDEPRLISVSNIESFHTKHPRIMHSHEDAVEILFVTAGSGVYVVDDQRYSISRGDVVICNPSVLHDELPEFSQELRAFCCTLTEVKLEGLEYNSLIENGVKPVFKADKEFECIHRLFNMLFQLLSSDIAGKEAAAHHVMMALLSVLIPILKHPEELEDKELSAIRELCLGTKEYINQHYMEDVTVVDIAKVMNISASRLSHIFKEHMGYSLKNYLLRRRIGESQTMLINTNESVTSIAAAVGYGNPNYFTAIFSKNVGMSPSQYRNTYSNKQ